jgi:hypothetical protein
MFGFLENHEFLAFKPQKFSDYKIFVFRVEKSGFKERLTIQIPMNTNSVFEWDFNKETPSDWALEIIEKAKIASEAALKSYRLVEIFEPTKEKETNE